MLPELDGADMCISNNIIITANYFFIEKTIYEGIDSMSVTFYNTAHSVIRVISKVC